MKRASSTTSTDYAQSSDSSHYAGNASKTARKVECRCHFTGKLTLLFADGNNVHPRLRQQLVPDNRPPLNSHELQMFVEEFEAEMVVAADCDPLELENCHSYQRDDTTWQVWCNPNSWKISQLEMIDLVPGWRHAVLITMQRSTSCGETLNVVAIKTLKGVAENPLFFSPRDHQQVANALFKLLSFATCPTVVLGNIGFALASCIKHLNEYNCDKEDLIHRLQILTTGDQVLMSLFVDSFKPIKDAQSTLIDAYAPKRMMIIRLDTDTPAPVHTELDTDADCHILGHAHIPCILTTRIAHMLKLLQTPSHECLAHALLLPVATKQKMSDGIHEFGHVHINSTLQMHEDVLMLVQKARQHAGHRQELTCLSADMFTKTLTFLQNYFEKNFMGNPKLKASICDLVERPAELSRNTKQKIRSDRRSAFKAWKSQLMGNIHFLHAVMRNGIFHLRDQQDLANAILYEQSSVDEHHAVVSVSVSEKDTLRAEAVHARQQIKKARRLIDASNSGAVLTPSEKKLCSQLKTGKLEEDRILKDEAYTYLRHRAAPDASATRPLASVGSASIEMAAVLRTFCCNHLEKYFLFTRPR